MARLPALLLAALLAAGCSAGERAPDASGRGGPTAGTAASPAPTAPPSGAPSGPAPAAAYPHYVALGDSYTAAPLVPPPDPATMCLRSRANYPTLVAAALPGTTLTDVSCSGADTADMTRPQTVWRPGRSGTVPPQLDAVKPDTDLVTIGIGGNDFGLFGTLVGRCPHLASDDPAGDPCRRALADGATDRLTEELPRIAVNVARVVEQVRARAPHARILVVGYPQIVPGSGTCRDRLPLAAGDYPWARSVNEGLTRAVRDGAESAHAEYLDVWRLTAGHDICAADPWINGWVTSADRALAYHPLAVEQRAVAEAILDRLRA